MDVKSPPLKGTQMARWSFILAPIPAVVFAIAGMAATKKTPAPIVAASAPPVDIGPRVVKTESITTFDGRWPFAAPPPAIEREICPVARERDVADATVSESVVSPTALPARHRLRTKRARLDLCGRHKMRKVYTRGGKSWRCKR